MKGSQHWLLLCVNIYCFLEQSGSELVTWFLINSQAQYFGWFKYWAVSVFWTELAEVCWTCRFVSVSSPHCWLWDVTPRLSHGFRVCSAGQWLPLLWKWLESSGNRELCRASKILIYTAIFISQWPKRDFSKVKHKHSACRWNPWDMLSCLENHFKN